MPLQHAVLALLSGGPSYGYELKSRFEDAIGPQWGGLNIGHMYQIIDRLVRDRYVSGEHIVQSDRPDKTVYELTEAGRQELRDWLDRPFVRQSGFRDDFFLKLFAASLFGPEEVRAVANRQRVAHLAEIRTLSDLKAEEGRDPLVELLIDAAVLDTRARLELAEAAVARADRLSRPAVKVKPDRAAAPQRKRRGA